MNETGRTVLSVVDDIFFAARIQAVAKAAGVRLVEAHAYEEFQSQLVTAMPDLVVVDLNSGPCRPLDAIRLLKSNPRFSAIPVIGFLSHIRTDLEKAARNAGCDRVLPRSRFTSQLPGLLTGNA